VGIYDRDYYRKPQQGLSLRMPQSMVVAIILVNVALYIIDGLLFQGDTFEDHKLTCFLSLDNETLRHPWMWWQFLTCGFVHDPFNVMHIIMNMVGLWFLGRMVEQIYGSKEFLRIYLVMVVFGSFCYALGSTAVNVITHKDTPYGLLGASGAVEGITVLFILNFPNVTLVLFPIPIPIKAWVLGIGLVAFNLYGVLQQSGNVAFGVHLAGIVFAWFYFQQRWNLGRFFEKFIHLPKTLSRPKFRVHHPDDEPDEKDLSAEVDRILEKISREGESSLTRQERRILETASRKYQQRRQ
jgi:membrane associated rhomboid family serine protease